MAVRHIGLQPRVESSIEVDVGTMVAKVPNQPDVQEDTRFAGATMMDQDSTN